MEEAEKKKETKISGRFGVRFRARTDKKATKSPEAAAESVAEPAAEAAPVRKPSPSMDKKPAHPEQAGATAPARSAPKVPRKPGKPANLPDKGREGQAGQGRAAKPAKPAKHAKPVAGLAALPEVSAAKKGETEPPAGPARETVRPERKAAAGGRPGGPQPRREHRHVTHPEAEPAPETGPMAEPGGETRAIYVDRQSDFEHFISALRRQKRFGIDLEADSLHHYQEKICLIQIGFPGKVYIIDPLAEINLGPLARILADPRVEKVLHGADYDGRLIMSHLGVRLRNTFDTMLASQILGKPQVGLASLLSDYFQVTMDKKHQRADWSRRPLAPSMLEYAGKDAEYLLSLRDALARELEEAGRLSWALEEFELLEAGLEILPGRSQEIYRIKGDRDLEPRQAAVLQSLLRWREGVAKRKDIPPFKIIPNEMLLKLAVLPPGEEDITRPDILTARLKGLYGPEIQKAFNKGRNSATLELPTKVGGGENRRLNRSAEKRLARLKEWRNHFAHDLSLDPGVMIPNSVMEAVAIANPRDLAELIGSGLLKRWQLQLFGEALLQILHTVPRGNQ